MMLRLFLVTEFETDWARRQWSELARLWNEDGKWCRVVEDPTAADAVLVTMVDPVVPYRDAVDALKSHPLWRSYRDRVFVFDTGSVPAGLFPGLYTSLRRSWFSQSRHRTSCYIASFNEFIEERPRDPRPPLLCSFQGNLTSRPRGTLMSMNVQRPDVLIERTEPFWQSIGSPDTRDFKERYALTIGQSRFVLCPRGIGISSFRLFETMQSGRVPVIIADSWVPCAQVEWEACSIRIAERDVRRVVEICESHDSTWSERAANARRAWEEWFSPLGLSHLIADCILGIRASRKFPERLHSLEWPVREGALRSRQALVRVKISAMRARALLTNALGQ